MFGKLQSTTCNARKGAWGNNCSLKRPDAMLVSIVSIRFSTMKYYLYFGLGRLNKVTLVKQTESVSIVIEGYHFK